jgi:hypothetical protein
VDLTDHFDTLIEQNRVSTHQLGLQPDTLRRRKKT